MASQEGKGGKWDVVLSYASEDRDYVATVAEHLLKRKVRLYYYEGDRPDALGVNLESFLRDIYSDKARYYCVAFLSRNYAASAWTRLELKAAQKRTIERHEEYLIPARFDDTPFDLVDEKLGYADLRHLAPDALAESIVQKIRHRNRLRRRNWLIMGAVYGVSAVATAAIWEVRALHEFRVPAWLTNEFVPAAHDLAINAGYVGQGSVDYLLTKPATWNVFMSEIEGVATATRQYNCAYSHFQSTKGYFSNDIASLPAGDLRDAAEVVANDVKTRFAHSYPVPYARRGPDAGDSGNFANAHGVLLETWRGNDMRIGAALEVFRNDIKSLDSAILRAAGLPETDCRHRSRR